MIFITCFICVDFLINSNSAVFATNTIDFNIACFKKNIKSKNEKQENERFYLARERYWILKKNCKFKKQTGLIKNLTLIELVKMLEEEECENIYLNGMVKSNSLALLNGNAKLIRGQIPMNFLKSSEIADEIVRRGADSFPILLKNISNKTKTKINIKIGDRYSLYTKGGGVFSERYCFNRNAPMDLELKTKREMNQKYISDNLKWPFVYNVTVGDYCYALISHICGRDTGPLNYIGNSIIEIRSPSKSKNLSEAIHFDFYGFSKKEHIELLVNDAIYLNSDYSDGSIERLLFYYSNEADVIFR